MSKTIDTVVFNKPIGTQEYTTVRTNDAELKVSENMQKTTDNANDIKILMICKAAFFTKNHLPTLNILLKLYKRQKLNNTFYFKIIIINCQEALLF